jgi:hypothetical protein
VSRAGALVVVVCVALLRASLAHADSSVVVLLRPPAASHEVEEAITRAEAELRAEGFIAIVKNAPTKGDPRAWLSMAAEEQGAIAAISVFGAGVGTKADLWVTDRLTGKTVIRTVNVADVPAKRRPAALAIRAVELLRASLVEALHPFEHKDARPPPTLPKDVTEWIQPKEPPKPPMAGFSLQIGVAGLFSVNDLGPSAGPTVRLGYGFDVGIALRAWIAGPTFGANAEGAIGSASVRQLAFGGELAWAPAVDWKGFTPVLFAGAGAYQLYAQGALNPPNRGRNDQVWAAAFPVGAGIGYRFTDQIALLLDGGVLFTVPRAVVTMQGEVVGSAGRPSVLADLALLARF